MLKLIRSLLLRRRCNHEWNEGSHINLGMNKMFECQRCGKVHFV